jgi:hypothetical protein
MTATITRLPTASPSFYTVRKVGRWWAVQIVTPAGMKPLRTTIATCADREEAIAYGQKRAAEMKRPFQTGGPAK